MSVIRFPYNVTGFLKGLNGGECTDDFFATYEEAKEFFDNAKKAQTEYPKRKWIVEGIMHFDGTKWATAA